MIKQCVFQKNNDGFSLNKNYSRKNRNNSQHIRFTHNTVLVEECVGIENRILELLKVKDNSIVIRRNQNTSASKVDISLIQCFFGKDKDRINAVTKALEINLKYGIQPIEHIFIEAQESYKDCKFKWLNKHGIKYVFKQITKESEGIFIKPALWNIGARMAETDKLAFLDSDVVMCSEDWLQSAYDELSENDVISLHSKCYYAEQEFDGSDSNLDYYKRLNPSIGYVIKNNIPGHGHAGFSIGMTKDFFDCHFRGFNCINSKHEDLLYWAQITGIDDYDVPYKGILKFQPLKENLKVGCGKSICAHIAHGPISERHYQESKEQLNDVPFSEFIYDKTSDELPIWRKDIVQRKTPEYSLKERQVFKEEYKDKIALVCIAKNEDLYIDEWIRYHQQQNFDQIFIYQNNWKCNFKSAYDNVTLKTQNEMDEIAQYNAYNNFISNYNEEFDYALFIDVDEFFYAEDFKDIHEVINHFSDVNFDCLVFNWLLFGDKSQIKVNGDYNVLPRFHLCEKTLDTHIKSLVNLKSVVKKQHEGWFWRSVHGLSRHDFNVYNANKRKLISPSEYKCWENAEDLKYLYDKFYIAHYRSKSLEECVQRNNMKKTWVSNVDKTVIPYVSFDSYTTHMNVVNFKVAKRLYDLKTEPCYCFCTVFRMSEKYFYLFLLNWLENIQRHHHNSLTYVFLNKIDNEYVINENAIKSKFKIDFIKVKFIVEENEFIGNNQIFHMIRYDFSDIPSDRILYLDVDMEINQTLIEPFEMDFEDNLMIVVNNDPPYDTVKTYDFYMDFVPQNYWNRFEKLKIIGIFNGGFMMLNLKKTNEIQQLFYDNYDFIREIESTRNQHILNYLYNDKVKFIDGRYNNLYSNNLNNFAFDKTISFINHYDTDNYKLVFLKNILENIL